MRAHLQRQQRAAAKAGAPKKKQTLAERLHLMRQRRKDTTQKQLKGWRAKLMHRTRRLRMMARRRPGRALLILAATFTLFGAFSGALIMRWRRIRMANAVVFTINQASVRRQDFQTRLEQAAGRTVMQGYLDQTLRRQFAEAKKATPTNAEVDARVAEDSKQPEFRQTLAAAGMDLDAYRQAVRDELSQVKLMSEGVTVTDQEVLDFYKRNIDKRNPSARFYTPETVQVAVIGTRSRETALAALEDLRQGVQWDDVARTHSVDVSAFSGGLLPPFGRGRTLAAQIPGMEQAIFGMQPGQRIGPAKFGEGWWIIQCRDKRPERTLPFEQVKHRARSWLLLEKGTARNGRRIASEYAAFQKKARVQVFDPLYRSMMTPAGR